MKGFKKYLLLFLTVSLVMGSLCSSGWTEEKWAKDDPVGQGWSLVDLAVARVAGVAAGIFG
jgi:hypothetical protein